MCASGTNNGLVNWQQGGAEHLFGWSTAREESRERVGVFSRPAKDPGSPADVFRLEALEAPRAASAFSKNLSLFVRLFSPLLNSSLLKLTKQNDGQRVGLTRLQRGAQNMCI